MTDALNQMIHHKREKTLPCSADADHPVPVLPFSLCAQDNVNKVQVAQIQLQSRSGLQNVTT